VTNLIDQLIDPYEPVTRAYCRSYRLSEDQVDDVIHDTFLAAYRNLPKYRRQTKFSSWLRTIARRQIFDQKRRRSSRERQIDSFHQLSISTQNPSTLAQSWELRQKLHICIAAGSV
jgi:RNA polymerase sigma factor (sigma-70 family)